MRVTSCMAFWLAITACAAEHTAPLLVRAARGEPVERTPVWMMRQAGRHMHAYRDLCAFHPTFRERSETASLSTTISLQPYHAYGVDGVIIFSDILTPLPAMGVDFSVSESGAIAVVPIRDAARLSAMEAHAFEPASALPFVGETLRALRQELANTEAAVIGFVGGPFTLATFLLEGSTGTTTDFARTRSMLREDPDLVHRLLALLSERLVEYAVHQHECGAQLVQVFDSFAGWLEPDDFEAWAAPYQRAVVREIKRRCPDCPTILYMAPLGCSRGGAYVEKLAASGADVVGIDHTVQLGAARQALDAAGHAAVTLQGNLDAALLRDGPEERIVAETERLLRCADGRGKHIMNLGHGIDPGTPEAHAAAFVRTVRHFRSEYTPM